MLISKLFNFRSKPKVESLPFDHPIFFVHGGGPAIIAGLGFYKQRFIELGVDPKHLVELKYSYRKSFAVAADQLKEQFYSTLRGYRAGTSFDVIGYSMGTAIALRAILEADLPVAKYISIAGVEFGQHKKPWFCKVAKHSDAFDILTPYGNEWIVNHHKCFAKKLGSFRKVAVHSVHDGNLHPYNANVFKDSIVHDLPYHSHIKLGRSYEVFKILQLEILGQ